MVSAEDLHMDALLCAADLQEVRAALARTHCVATKHHSRRSCPIRQYKSAST